MSKLDWRKTSVAAPALFVTLAAGLRAQTLTTLFSFDGNDGETPFSALVQGTDGDFYGTTNSGGAHRGGTVFRISSTSALKTLYNFCSRSNCSDGFRPAAGLVLASNGDFYGTTADGGVSGVGTIFKLTLSGKMTNLYTFSCGPSGCTSGKFPTAPLIQATNENLYGTTAQGGASTDCSTGCGTIFEMSPAGDLTTLYDFCAKADCADGQYADSALAQASDGSFYGATFGGGSLACPFGCGTVFRISPNGRLTTLYSFCSQSNCADGESPQAALLQASDGNFYGTTRFGGSFVGCPSIYGCGTVFKTHIHWQVNHSLYLLLPKRLR
jgi:uncharacterized repeat protein (TIGR03803 family)